MNLITTATRTALLSLFLAPALLAQSGPMPPPALLRIEREEVKAGHGAAHMKTEAAWGQAFAKAKSTDYYLGMSSMTGPSEAWFLIGYRSFADWEAKQAEGEAWPAAAKEAVDHASSQDGEHLTGTRSILAAYRKGLNFGPEVEIGKMRYLARRIFGDAERTVQLFGECAEHRLRAARQVGAYELLRRRHHRLHPTVLRQVSAFVIGRIAEVPVMNRELLVKPARRIRALGEHAEQHRVVVAHQVATDGRTRW